MGLRLSKLLLVPFFFMTGVLFAAEPGEEGINAALALGVEPVGYPPARGDESAGPFPRLLIENTFIVNGAGAPTRGPVTIEIENDRIVGIHGGGTAAMVGGTEIKGAGTEVIDAAPELLAAAIDEAQKLGMKTTMHHAQVSVVGTNVLDSARMGLDSMEHWYGLPEAMFDDKVIQDYPYDYNYNNEQDRFGEAGRLWLQSAAPGSETWNATIDELIGLDFTIDPTFTIYEANRDLMRARFAEWHDEYTMPYMMRAYEPDSVVHGSYFFDWTTAHEINWKRNYQRWMLFINDYKNAGGRVTTGSDAGYIYKIYGFGYIRELELLQEAGFHPLEVVKAATHNGAELLDMDKDIGSIQIGKKADLVIVDRNPLANFKVLYGSGHRILNKETGKLEQQPGIRYTIKDGIVFDAHKMLARVRELVEEQQAREAEK